MDFKNRSNYLEITSPVSWIEAGEGDGEPNPTRKREKIKAHARLRDYLGFKLLSTKFSGDELFFKLAISSNLKDIDAEVSKRNTHGNLQKQYDLEKSKTKKMRMIVDQSTEEKEFNCVKKWFQSDVCKNIEHEVVEIHKQAMDSKKINAEPFNKVASATRFQFAVGDKNRPSIYTFKNEDYLSKVKAWLPDLDTNIWRLDQLPPGWKMYQEPSPGEPPSCFEIRLDGTLAQTKGQAATNIIIDRRSWQLAEMYRDLKKICFGHISPSDPFFVNHRGLPLSRLQRTPGSLVEKFGEVTGVTDFTMTCLRRAAEGVIQGDKDLRVITKDLNNHSSQVVPVYDIAASMRRNVFLSGMSQAEGSSSSSDVINAEFTSLFNDREKQDEEDHENLKEVASMYLDEKKKKKPVIDLTPTTLDDTEINFLGGLFSSGEIKDDNFEKRFYQLVDGLPSPEGKMLRKMEEKVFRTQRARVLKDLRKKIWSGSEAENELADRKIR